MDSMQLKLARPRPDEKSRANADLAVGDCVWRVALLLAGGFIEWIFWAMREDAIRTGTGHVQVSRPGFRDEGLPTPRAFCCPKTAPSSRSRVVRRTWKWSASA